LIHLLLHSFSQTLVDLVFVSWQKKKRYRLLISDMRKAQPGSWVESSDHGSPKRKRCPCAFICRPSHSRWKRRPRRRQRWTTTRSRRGPQSGDKMAQNSSNSG
jgi:hypothetical protein